MKNKLIAFLMAVAMIAGANSQVSAMSSCYFYAGQRGELMVVNGGNAWLTVTFGMNGWFEQSVAPGTVEQVGWDDEPAVAIDSAGNVVCSSNPLGRG